MTDVTKAERRSAWHPACCVACLAVRRAQPPAACSFRGFLKGAFSGTHFGDIVVNPDVALAWPWPWHG
jgi:hypothetical protein